MRLYFFLLLTALCSIFTHGGQYGLLTQCEPGKELNSKELNSEELNSEADNLYTVMNRFIIRFHSRRLLNYNDQITSGGRTLLLIGVMEKICNYVGGKSASKTNPLEGNSDQSETRITSEEQLIGYLDAIILTAFNLERVFFTKNHIEKIVAQTITDLNGIQCSDKLRDNDFPESPESPEAPVSYSEVGISASKLINFFSACQKRILSRQAYFSDVCTIL